MRKSKLFIALLLTLALCFGGAASAFAGQSQITDTEDPSVGVVVTDDTSSVQASIAKVLQMPVGTAVPATTFKFKAAAASNDTGVSTSDMPVITNALTVSYTGDEHDGVILADGNTIAYTKETGNILQFNKPFPHAGVYVYTIYEDLSGISANTATEEMAYSGAKYTLTLYVANDDNGDGGLYIKALSDVIYTTDNNSQTQGDKVDPTPGKSQMTFTNTYVHTKVSTVDTDNNTVTHPTLSVSKKVVGVYADQTKYFDYSMTVTAPKLVYSGDGELEGDLPLESITLNSGEKSTENDDILPLPVPFLNEGGDPAPVYKAYVIDTATNEIVTSTDNGAAEGDDYIEFTSGEATSFSLKHGQTLVFVDTPVGTTFDVNETGTPRYIPSADIYGNDTDGVYPTMPAHFAADADEDLPTDTYLVSENANTADFTNTLNDVTPTGIIINNLPYIGLVALAAAALVVYLTLKMRKQKRYNH